MGVRDRLVAALAALRGAPAAKGTGSQTAWNTIFTTGMDAWFAGQGKLVQPYAQHPTIYAAVSAIAQGIAGLPLEMFPDGEEEREEPLTDSVVAQLLETPGPDMDGPQLIEGTIVYMELYGEAFWFLDGMAKRTAAGPKYPTRIELWTPINVRAVTKNDVVVAWEYQSGQEIFRTAAENVVQFKYFNPHDAVRGLAPLNAAMLPAEGGWKALQYQDAFFENSTVMSGLITPKAGNIMQQEAMLRLRDEMEARHQGARKRGRLGAINAPVDYLPLGESHRDMDFPTWLDAVSAYILMVFKVPPSVAGLQKEANYNASVQQAKQFWYNHMPLVHYLERRIKARLCRPFSIAETPYFKTESIKAMTEDQEAVSNIARNLFNMGVSFHDINERMELGYPAEDVAAETRWLPFSMVNADEQAMAPGRDATGGPARGPVSGDTPAQPGDESTVADDPTEGKRARPRLVRMPADSREFNRAINWQQLIGNVRGEEAAYESRLRKHFWILKNEVLANLRAAQKDIKPLEFSIDAVLFDKEKAAKDIQRRTDDLYKSALVKGYETVIRELHIDLPFDLLTPEVESFLLEKRFEIPDLVDGPTEARLRAELEEAVRKGENLEKVANRVKEAFDVELTRARRIARTEIAESFNGGRFETMKEAGVEKLEWLTARDARVRDSHAEIDGQIVVLGDKFSNGLYYPLDPAGPPEEIVNCRCVALPAA